MAAARALVERLATELGDTRVEELLGADQASEANRGPARTRPRAAQKLAAMEPPEARQLEDSRIISSRKVSGCLGGDGWAYDIGYGGLDHVLASNRNINVLVLDTEVYSNTGGQQSKATPLGAVAKFASAGKSTAKKDLGLLANSYGHVYIARIAKGDKCRKRCSISRGRIVSRAIAHHRLQPLHRHGYDMAHGMSQQKLAVDSGVWPLYRFDPRRLAKGEPPLHLDYGPPKARVADYMPTRRASASSSAPIPRASRVF